MTDQELAAGIAQGNPEAIDALLDRFHRPVLRFLWHTSGSKEDAEDLAAQALIKVRATAHRFRAKGSLQSWIFQIAYREFLQHRRRQVLSRLLTPRVPVLSQPPSDDAIVIGQAISRVPLLQRNAFLLTEVEGLSVEEAGAALGVPPGTVKSRCHAARKRLQLLLGPTYGDEHAEAITD